MADKLLTLALHVKWCSSFVLGISVIGPRREGFDIKFSHDLRLVWLGRNAAPPPIFAETRRNSSCLPQTATHSVPPRHPAGVLPVAPSAGRLDMRMRTYLNRKGARYHFRRRLPATSRDHAALTVLVHTADTAKARWLARRLAMLRDEIAMIEGQRTNTDSLAVVELQGDL